MDIKVVEIIDRRIEEHKIEVKQAEERIKEIQSEMKKNKPELIHLQELAVTKDKLLFHKSSSMVLIDLKKEIQSAPS